MAYEEAQEQAMSKLYVGNLPADVTELSLRELFAEKSITCSTVLVKRGGYAFVDCPDQSSADRAIDLLNGFSFQGSTIVVEPSVAGGAKKRGSGGGDSDSPTGEQLGNGWSANCKIILSNVPAHARLDDVEQLCSQYGHVQSCDKLTSRDGNQVVQVIYEIQDQAQHAVSQLNGFQYEGQQLKAELPMERGRGGRRALRGGGPMGGLPSARQTDFPLRILVQSDMVGAIIGRQGTTIRQITQQTRARVDVHRKDNVGSLEKAITIYGNPDNCTNACKQILEVMQAEATNTNKGEISLKILAHNNLIGRIIGKGGNTIKRIMHDTDTKITVSSINDINSFNLERIITVKGTIDNMSRAESMISAKLRQSYENDLQAMAPQSMMFPGLHPMAMMSTNSMGYSGRGGGGGGPGGFGGGLYGAGGPMGPPPPYPPLYPAAPPPPPSQQSATAGGAATACVPDHQETTYLFIPNNAVGAIIGTKGTHIRNIIRFSGASVKIAQLETEAGGGGLGSKGGSTSGLAATGSTTAPTGSATASATGTATGTVTPSEQHLERKVTIVGTPESQWKAQFLIFEKMREEGFVGSGTEDVRLTVEILVPSSQVGRIIGKGGQNVRELQRVTGSVIKLPEQGTAPPTQEETTVHIIGPFYSVQSAQRRIRAMVQQTVPGGSAPRGPPPNTRREPRE